MGAGKFSCGVFVDLKKAFDTVDHGILLKKLAHYGFRGLINDWFSSYLQERVQVTVVGNRSSNKTGVLSGADIQKSRSSDIVMLAGKYGILDKKLAGN